MRQAFSLVELSIVLVILGLLTGGILAGQSLIRAAELRSVSTEHDRWASATNTFRDKYFALPGDMTNATAFWGDDNAVCPDAAVTNGSPGTCNGNSNGQIGLNSPDVTESLRYWQQLTLAGLIEGNYRGILISGNLVPGENLPRSKFPNAVWSAFYRSPNNPDPIYGYSGNLFMFSRAETSPTVWTTVMKPEEAWNIDTKMDDGKPGLGRMMAGGDTTACVTPNSIDYNAAGAANRNAAYALVITTNECRLWFKL